MKILFAIAHLGKGGGQVTQSARIIKELSKNNKTMLLTLKTDTDVVAPPCKTVYAGKFSFPLGVYSLYKKIREAKDFDVVQCFDGYYSFPAAFFARKKPYFLRMGMDPESFLREKGAPFAKQFGKLQMLPLALKDCAKFIVNGTTLLDICKEYNPVLIQNGYDLNEFHVRESKETLRKRLKLPKNKTILLYTGKLLSRKKLEILFRLLKQTDNIFLVLLGDDGQGSYSQQLMQSYSSLKKKFTIRPEVSMDYVKYYLKACDIFAFPSSLEGSPNSLLEAMAAGIPVVCSDIPNHRELIKHKETGLLFKDLTQLRKAVESLQDSGLRNKIAKAAKLYVKKHHNIKDKAKQYMELYKSALK